MKSVVGALIAILVAAYAYLAFVGVEPADRRPGTLLAGTEQPLPMDLSFLDAAMEVELETRPWFGIPFSVTVVVARDENAIYVPSLYDAAQPFPGTKYWNHVVAANPNVRLRVEETLYPLSITPVMDQTEFRAAFAALGRKYPFWREQMTLDDSQPRFALLRLQPR